MFPLILSILIQSNKACCDLFQIQASHLKYMVCSYLISSDPFTRITFPENKGLSLNTFVSVFGVFQEGFLFGWEKNCVVQAS